MRTESMLFVCGALLLLQSSALPPLYPCLLLLLLVALLAGKYRICRWILWLGAGFCWCLLRADGLLDNHLDPALEGVPLTIEGRISGLPVCRRDTCRFVLKTQAPVGNAGQQKDFPRRIRISWYDHSPLLVPGQLWRLRVKLKRPWGFMNPGGFDFEGWLFQQGIRATGYVLEKGENRLLEASVPMSVDYLRHTIRQKLATVVLNDLPAALIPALVVGDGSRMEDQNWRVLTATGTNHLLAISGLHIGLVAGMVFFLLRRLWPLSGKLAVAMASPRAAALAAMLAAVVYAALAGFAIPTRRALVMTGAVLLQTLLYRRFSHSHVFCLALLLVVVIDPMDVLAPGFWLSFGAVGLILYGMSHRTGIRGLWWRWGRTQYVVALGLAPMLTFWFRQIPVTGMLANLVAVPWVSLVSIPLVLGGSLLLPVADSLAGFVLWLAAISLEWIWLFLEKLAEFGPGVLALPAPSPFALISGMIAVLVLLAPRGIPGRWLGIICLLPLLSPIRTQPSPGEFSLVLLDVGQGLAAAIRTREHLVLYDTGPRYSDMSNAGGSVILPWLRHAGLDRVDLLILSHGDADHAGGLRDVLQDVEVGAVISSIPQEVVHQDSRECHSGQSWEFDDVHLQILHPPRNTRFQGNNASCVLKVSTRNFSVLLPGDIEREAEWGLVRDHAAEIRADVLVVPHHGSKSSSTTAFIRATGARYVLFSAGYRNRFGFPNQDIIARYQATGSRMLDTARSGAIEMRFTDSGIDTIRRRQNSRRFWHSDYYLPEQ